MILDVVGKPGKPLTWIEESNGARKFSDENGAYYWRVIDIWGNEIWYAVRDAGPSDGSLVRKGGIA